MAPDEPVELDIHRWSRKQKTWRKTRHSTVDAPAPEPSALPHSLKLLTWNVDFAAEDPAARMRRILSYLQLRMLKCADDERPSATAILMQEVHPDALVEIRASKFVQRWFVLVDGGWPAGALYGCVTLVSRSVVVRRAWTMQFSNSVMGRTALITDVLLSVPRPHEQRVVTTRIANTHLESLPIGESARPRQLRLITDVLKADGLHGALVAGDMNAISHADSLLPQKLGLKDAWQSGEDARGHTWGFQSDNAADKEFPPARMDKVLYVQREGYTVEEPQRVGIRVQTVKMKMVSDHCGLLSNVHVVSG